MSKKRQPEIPIDPPTEYFAVVGEVAVRWARLEYQLGVLTRVGFRLGKDEQRSLIIGMNMTVLAGVLRAVAQGWLKDKKLSQKLKEFADEIAELRNKRGDYAHGHWSGEPQKWFMFNMKSPKQRGQVATEPTSPKEIAAFAIKLRKLQLRAQELTAELKATYAKPPKAV